MRSQEEIIKRVFAPLNLSVNLEVLTPLTPVTQIFNEATNQVEPTRQVNPCVICPTIRAWANDGSWETMESNKFLVNMKWLVAGTDKKEWVDISTLKDWESTDPNNPKFEIDTSEAYTRGAISIYRDLPANTKIALKFVAELYDSRLNAKYDIKTDEIILSTINKGEDSYGISIGDATNILYNPLLDKLFAYEYETSHGFATASDAVRKACFDGFQYERTIEINVYKGKKKAPVADYSIQIWRVGATSALTPGANELISLSNINAVFDLRLIENQSYEVKLIVNKKVVASTMFSISRKQLDFECRPMNGTSIEYGDINRYHKALVHDDHSNVVAHPENILKMIWHTESTDSANGNAVTSKTWNEGNETVFPIDEAGLGENDYDLMHVYFEYDQKPAHDFAVDNKNNLFTDEKGNYFIIN